ncbi:MAG: hypothetical protein OEX81_05315 [Candidatus Pacebacteria bacterium]|nr:hypothetical protein [Candidatus Paceibacterota bacterium]
MILIDTEHITSNKNSLKNYIEQSDLADSERLEKLKELFRNAKWVGTGTEFVYLLKKSESNMGPHDPFVLGLSKKFDITGSFAKELRGDEWEASYGKLGINPDDPNHTSNFMEAITELPDRDIVFFIPPQVFSHPEVLSRGGGQVTRNEIQWLLDNPEKAKNVFLVFGGYDLVDKEGHRQLYGIVGKDYRQEEIQEELTQIIKDLFSVEDKR